MARMRSLKPEFWVDRKIARNLTRDQRMLYLALWNQADEWGRLMADPRLIKGQCFPYDDDLSLSVLEGMMRALEGAGVAQIYAVDGDPYVFLPKLAKHQRLEPAKVPSRLPEPPALGSDQQVCAAPEVRANESARDANESAPRANTLSLKQVAGSRLQVAGQPRADKSAPISEMNAQELLGIWLDTLNRRPAGSVIGQLGKHVKALLEDGFQQQEILDGLNAMQEKGMHPSTLPSFVTAKAVRSKSKPMRNPEEMHSPATRFSG